MWRGLELAAQDIGESAVSGFHDGAGVMGDSKGAAWRQHAWRWAFS